MLEPGEVVNKYRVISLLVHGGMSSVYVVEHLKLPRRFALKLITSHLATDEAFLNRFRQEAVILATLDHPHIVQVFDWDVTESGHPYLVMELLQGEDLASFQSPQGALPKSLVLSLITQIGAALQFAHDRDIVHRDLKPANVFLCRNGISPHFVKVLDFGIAKSLNAPSPMNTSEAVTIGTPAYMAPEQARGGSKLVDGRADQFSLSAIAYALFSGNQPFVNDGDDVETTLLRILSHEPPPLADPAIDAVIRRALAKDRALRFPSVAAFVSALEEAVTASSVVADGSPAIPSSVPRSESVPPSPPSSPSASMISSRRGELLPKPATERFLLGGVLGLLAVAAMVSGVTFAVARLWYPKPSHTAAEGAVRTPGVEDVADGSSKDSGEHRALDLAWPTAPDLWRPADEPEVPTAPTPATRVQLHRPSPAAPPRPLPAPPRPLPGGSYKVEFLGVTPDSAAPATVVIRACVESMLRPIMRTLLDRPIELRKTGHLLVFTPIEPFEYQDSLNSCLQRNLAATLIPQRATFVIRRAK
jgi:serine/threonine protein kinase